MTQTGGIVLVGQAKDDGEAGDSSRPERAGGLLAGGVVSQASHHRIGHLGPSRQDWRTPEGLFYLLDIEFNFNLDAAASHDNALCSRYFTEADDALTQEWTGQVFCNPPYRRLGPWVQKAYDESRKGATVVMLLPASTDSRWFHDIVQPAVKDGRAEVRFLRGRLKFEGAQHPATFASMVVVFRPWKVNAG